MRRATFVMATAVLLSCVGMAAVAQTTIETDGEVKAQGFDGDGSKLTNVDAATLGGEASGSFATAAELLAPIEALDNPDGPCFNATQRFVDCSNGTVTDTYTGLIYLKNANCFGPQDWPAANQSAATLADGSCGSTDGSRVGDWRLKTQDEFRTILASSCSSGPYIVGNGSDSSIGCHVDSPWASGVESSSYWSSTTYFSDTSSALNAYLNGGGVGPLSKTITAYVWPVRGGQ